MSSDPNSRPDPPAADENNTTRKDDDETMKVEEDEAKPSVNNNDSNDGEDNKGENDTNNEMKEDKDNDDKDSNDSDSIASIDSDDSISAAPKEDPEVLLVKAMTHKDEGNNHYRSLNFEKASRSYRRGVNALKPLNKQNTGDVQVKDLLLSLQNNLSMMCFKLNKHKQCCQVATAALRIDPASVKALYRRAVAKRKMGDQEEARKDLREALKYEPKNSAVRKELASVKKEIDRIQKNQKESLKKAFSSSSKSGFLYDDKEEERLKKIKREEEQIKKRKARWEDECVKRMTKGETVLSFEEWEKERKEKEEKHRDKEEKRKKKEQKERDEERRKAREAANANKKNEQSDDDSDDELTERELAQLRGYKKTSDGRTTSYFSREQTHAEKNLLGDITPKRLEATTASVGGLPLTPTSSGGNQQQQPQSDGKGDASVWNTAGTWEEKDTTDWCQGHLISRLKETKTEATGSGSKLVVGMITKVDDVTGDASVAIASGRKKYIFEFHCKLKFDIRDPDTDEVLASGSLRLPDICSTSHGEELEVTGGGWKTRPSPSYEQVANECRLALVSEIRESVQLWVSDFNKMY